MAISISFWIQKLFEVISVIGIFFKERPDLTRKLIVMFAPYLLIITSGWDWMFANYSQDPFHYSAIFLNYNNSEFFRGLDGYKYGRLPWILSGYLAFSIFSPKVATLILASTFFSLALLGVYIFIRNMFNESIAFVIALALGFFTTFHMAHSGGVFYHNLSSATFLIWSFTMLSRVILDNEKRNRYIFYSGIFAALALHCNITIINFLPLYLFFFYLGEGVRSLKLIVRRLGIFLAGGVAITIVLILINWVIRGEPFFFGNVVRLVKHAIRDPEFQKPWWESWSSLWFLQKRHVLVLSGIYFGAIALIPFKSTWTYALHSKNGRCALYCVGQYIFLFSLWIFWQTEGQTALNIDYFSYPLIIPAFICLSGLLFLGTKGTFSISLKWNWILPLLFLGITVSGMGLYVRLEMMTYLYVIGALLIFVLIYCKSTSSVLLWLVIFSILCGLSNDRADYKIRHSECSSSNRDYTLAVVKGQQYVSSIGPWDDIRVFFSPSEQILDQDGKSLGWHPISTLNLWKTIVNIWGKDLFASENIKSKEISSIIDDKKTLVVISKDEDNYRKLRDLFNNHGANLIEVGNYPITLKEGGSFSIRSFKALK